jgi:hypothetical protein
VPGSEGFDGLDEPVWPLLDGGVLGLEEEDEDGDDADDDELVLPPPAPGALEFSELREAHPASAASTTAVVATDFTRGFISLHLLADTVTGIWTQRLPRRFPAFSRIFADVRRRS